MNKKTPVFLCIYLKETNPPPPPPPHRTCTKLKISRKFVYITKYNVKYGPVKVCEIRPSKLKKNKFLFNFARS